MTPDGLLQQNRDKIVRQSQPSRSRQEQPHQIVDKQTTAPACVRNKVLGHKIPHRISQRSPHKSSHEVPQADIHRPRGPQNRHHEIEDQQQQTQFRHRVNPNRGLSPFEGLPFPAESHQPWPAPQTAKPQKISQDSTTLVTGRIVSRGIAQ